MPLPDRPRMILVPIQTKKRGNVMCVIELPLETGGSVLFEVEDLATEHKTVRGSGPASVKQLTTTFESVIGKLKPVVETIAQQFASLAKAPDLVEVEFAVKLSADAGVIIARAGSEASLRVKVGWKKAG